MHGMKGLEFQAVAVIGVGQDQVPASAAVTPESEDPRRMLRMCSGSAAYCLWPVRGLGTTFTCRTPASRARSCPGELTGPGLDR